MPSALSASSYQEQPLSFPGYNRISRFFFSSGQLQSSWDGRAKEAYETSKAKWTDGMNGIVDILTNVSNAVMEARQSAEATDSRNAASFS